VEGTLKLVPILIEFSFLFYFHFRF